MRGEDERCGSLLGCVDLEARVGKDHPLRAVRMLVNEALGALAKEFGALYSPNGWPSIPPLGAPAGGAAGVRPPVPFVCGPWDVRSPRHSRVRLPVPNHGGQFFACLFIKKIGANRAPNKNPSQNPRQVCFFASPRNRGIVCGDEKEPQTEAAAAVSVTVGDDLEAFERSRLKVPASAACWKSLRREGDDGLAWRAFAGDGAVSFLLGCRSRGLFGSRFFWHVCLGVPLPQALIAAFDDGSCAGMQPHLRCLEQPEAARPTFLLRKGERSKLRERRLRRDAAGRFLDNELGFQRVPLLRA